MRSILAGLPVGRDPDGRATSARCSLLVLERKFSEALQILQAYPAEALPQVGWTFLGFGTPELKARSEAIIRFYAGDITGAYDCLDAIRWHYEVATRDHPESIFAHADLAEVYSMMGWKEATLAEMGRADELQTAAKIPEDQRFDWTSNYLRVGEVDRALAELEKLMASPNPPYLNSLRLDPTYDAFRNDRAFRSWWRAASF